MIDKLIEGKLVTLLVGSVFRVVEIFVRTVHITVRGIRLLVQDTVTTRIDAWLSGVGKRRVARRARIDASSVVLIEQSGEYTGDVKYVAEELLRRGTPVTITWMLRDRSVGPFPRPFHFVRLGTADGFRSIASAKVVVQSGRSLQELGAVPSAGQHWLQLGADDAATLGSPRTDLLVSASAQATAELRKKVLDRLGVADHGQRFVLYTPAHGDRRISPLSGVDYAAVRDSLAERFGGEWEFLIRTDIPGKAASDALLAGLPAYCRNASIHPDLQELLVVADAGIGDRSGWMADFLLTGKPAFLFSTASAGVRAASAEEFTVAGSNEELVRAIEGFDETAHEAAAARFFERFGGGADGRAASRVADRIEHLLAR